jgi:hypothetical protein
MVVATALVALLAHHKATLVALVAGVHTLVQVALAQAVKEMQVALTHHPPLTVAVAVVLVLLELILLLEAED